MKKQTQDSTHSNIVLTSFQKLKDFTEKIKFPHNLSPDEQVELQREIQWAISEGKIRKDEAREKYCSPRYMRIKKALLGFSPIKTKDNDKRTRTKKISIRILVDKSQSKYVVISPGLYDLLDWPEYLSFSVKDAVLAIGEELPNANRYEVIVGQHGFMINSASLVDYLCEKFNLLDFKGDMNSTRKSFKTSFDEYTEADLKLSNGDYIKVVFIYMAPSF